MEPGPTNQQLLQQQELQEPHIESPNTNNNAGGVANAPGAGGAGRLVPDSTDLSMLGLDFSEVDMVAGQEVLNHSTFLVALYSVAYLPSCICVFTDFSWSCDVSPTTFVTFFTHVEIWQ